MMMLALTFFFSNYVFISFFFLSSRVLSNMFSSYLFHSFFFSVLRVLQVHTNLQMLIRQHRVLRVLMVSIQL